jgi:RNA polymerase sigma-70 factor (ECF subfamily)
MGPSHDRELVERWRRGDPAAFEALVRRWQQPVARLLGRLRGRDESVADLCQEVFLRVYHARARYRENGAFAAWLYRIALNVAHDAGRRRRREPGPLAGHEPADGRAPAEEVCEQEEAAGAVRRAVAELPEPLRVALVLHHYEKLNFEEIARLTGTPASTVKSRFAAALGRLRVRLGQLGWGPEETSP